MLSPDDISQRRFLVALRGYDRDEVSTFLREVADEVRALRARVAELQAEVARADERSASGDADPRAAFQALGEETTRILVAAEESARDIEARAAAAAEAQRDEAARDARDTLEKANRQAARTIAEAERRRDAIAAEIAGLREERDRFVQGLRASMASIGGVVGGLDEPSPGPEAAGSVTPEPEAPQPVAPEPVRVEPPSDQLVMDSGEDPEGPIPGTEPVLLESADAVTPVAEPEAEPDAAEESVDEPTIAEPAVDEPPVDEPAAEVVETIDTVEVVEVVEAVDGAAVDGAGVPTVESRRDDRLVEVRTAMTRQCKRGLQEIQNEVLASIRDHGRGARLDDLLPHEGDLDDLGTQGATHLAAAYNGALEDAAAEVAADPPAALVDGARVQAAVATFRAVLSHEVTSALRATLRAGLEAEEPEPQLSERVGEVFRDLRGPVIEATVDEHLQRTYGHGLLDAWQELGVGRILWQAHEEARCPEGRCRTNAAEGPVGLGEDFPSGDRVPPAHPGCTCVVVPATT